MTGAGRIDVAEIVVRGEEFVSVRLTPGAYAHGLAVALPEEVEVPVLPGRDGHGRMWCWRPTGFERATPMGALVEAIARSGR